MVKKFKEHLPEMDKATDVFAVFQAQFLFFVFSILCKVKPRFLEEAATLEM